MFFFFFLLALTASFFFLVFFFPGEVFALFSPHGPLYCASVVMIVHLFLSFLFCFHGRLQRRRTEKKKKRRDAGKR